MDVALAEPDVELAAGHALQPQAQEHVRQEEDLLVGRDTASMTARALLEVQQ
jgi:hypothetical protein